MWHANIEKFPRKSLVYARTGSNNHMIVDTTEQALLANRVS